MIDQRTGNLVDDLEQLQSAIERHAIRVLDGPVQLASGGWSNYYCDVRVLTLHPLYARMIGALMAPAIIESGAEAVGGMAMGSIALSSAVADAALNLGHTIPTFFVRPQPKEHGASAHASITMSVADDADPLIRPGRKVAIVEDTVTQGGSAMKAVDAVLAEGCDVVLVMSVVERHEAGAAKFRERGIPFARLFYTDDTGKLYVDEELAARIHPRGAGVQ
jgi:orotate phosphoribosyltransferase